MIVLVLLVGCDIGTKPEKSTITPVINNPSSETRGSFGVFYALNQQPAVEELNANVRVLVFQWFIDKGKEFITDTDKSFIKNKDNDIKGMITFIYETEERRIGDNPTGNQEFCIPEGEELEKSKEFTRKYIERYDGDDDFGCDLKAPDCYKARDNLYPSQEVQEAIKQKPNHYWQIENEFTYQVKDCENNPEGEYLSKEKITDFVKEMSNTIRETDDKAVVVGPSFTGYEQVLLYDNRIDYIEIGKTDCRYRKIYYEDLEGHNQLENVAIQKERFEYLLTEATDFYDVIDFHYYGNNYYLPEPFMAWMDDLGLSDKKVFSTEIATPHYFFEAIGSEQPTECVNSGRDIRTPDRYDEAILSSSIIKTYVVALNAGVDELYWASLTELFDPYTDTFRRPALISEEGVKKPAFYTYKLMVEKIYGFTSVKEIEEDIYLFSFEDGKRIIVAWSEEDKIINLSYLVSGEVGVTYLITEESETTAKTEITSSSSILITDQPIFIEMLE